MSNMICTTPMCTDGQASVQQMRRTFNILSSNAAFNSPRFEPRVLEIEQAYEDAAGYFSEWIPFNPTCCTLYEIGKQADNVTDEMNRSAGVATTGTGPSSTPGGNGFDLDSLITVGGLALGVMFLANLQAVTRRS